MKNTMKRATLLTTLVCLVPVVAGILLYSKLPNTIVTHWGANGEPNGWSSRFVGAIVFPGILVLVNLLYPVLLKLDPKYENMNEKLVHLGHWIIPIISVICAGTTLSAALGINVKIALIAPMLLGVMFIAIGNYLPKTKQSYMLGIRLPWTLSDEENWNKTHRMAGFLWVIGGLLMVIGAALGIGAVATIVIGVILVLVPTVYSYWLYRKNNP